MVETTLRQPAFRPRAIPEMVIDRIWRFFCSVRVAVFEIAFLALLVLIGTLRGSSVPRTIADTFPALTPLVDRWDAWEIFQSIPFIGVLTILSIAVAVCTMNRAPGIWQAIAHPTVTTTHGFLRNAETSVRFESAGAVDALSSQVLTELQQKGYRTLTADVSGGLHIYADRWRFSRLATFPFHLALIMILVGGIVGAAWGFRENQFVVPEESVRDLGHGTGLSVRLDDFSEVYREDGSPLIFRSDVTLLKNGLAIDSGSMTVNNPYTYGDVVFYQSGFGQAVALNIVDGSGNVLLDDSLPLGQFQSKLNPDAPAARLDLIPAGVALSVVAPDTNPVNAPEMDTLNLRPGELFFMIRPLGPESPIDIPVGKTIRQGESIQLGNLTLTFERERRFSALQVARNPGIPVFIAAAILLVGGLAITFYFPHRRIRGIVSASNDGSVIHLAPMAKRDWSAQRVFAQLIQSLSHSMGLPSIIVNQADSDLFGDQQPSPQPRPVEVG